ncbi:MAG: helix-turn-helix domain-containing protein [Thermoguttaceae bacterium]|nr:helix-turn-helix domain-containing protein [Thermoguttaceae bacterium]
MDGEDVCIYLNICYRTLKKLYESGKLVGRRIGRKYVFTEENVLKYLNGRD